VLVVVTGWLDRQERQAIAYGSRKLKSAT
jgi:hypothetical protein